MRRDFPLALLAMLTVLTPIGPANSLATLALIGFSLWVIIDRSVDIGTHFWNRWISP